MKHTGVTLLLTLLAALSSLTACITTDPTLGSALVSEDQDITIHTASFDLPVDMKMADSLQTTVSQNMTVGAIRTGRFGLFHCDAAAALTASTDSIVWGRNPTVRSLTLTLTLDTTLVVDKSQLYIPQNIYVHRLKVQLDSTRVYNNSLTENDYDHELLSEGGLVYTGGETYGVTLKKSLAEELFRYPTATLDSASLFMQQCRGLYFRCDDPIEGQEGGRLNCFDLSNSYLSLNYEYDDDDGVHKAGFAYFMLGEYYSVNICSSGSGALEKADPAQALYLEGLCGIKPHVDARTLRAKVVSWAASQQIPLENLVIAKATLSLPFDYDGHYDQFDHYPSTLYPCTRERNESSFLSYAPILEIQDENMESGTIDRSLLEYKSNISIYLQDLVRKDAGAVTDEDDLWIMPTLSYYNSNTSTTYYYVDYFNYTQSVLNGTAAARHPVVHLTYTVLK